MSGRYPVTLSWGEANPNISVTLQLPGRDSSLWEISKVLSSIPFRLKPNFEKKNPSTSMLLSGQLYSQASTVSMCSGNFV